MCDSCFITKCDKFYYEVRQVLLHRATILSKQESDDCCKVSPAKWKIIF